MPKSLVIHSLISFCQYSNHFSHPHCSAFVCVKSAPACAGRFVCEAALGGLMKYSNSIKLNSRVLKIKFPGVISFRNALPCEAIPNGNLRLVVSRTCLKLTNIACAISGLKYTSFAFSSAGPRKVFSIKLNCFASVKASFIFSNSNDVETLSFL